jgi:hypothetical protein
MTKINEKHDFIFPFHGPRMGTIQSNDCTVPFLLCIALCNVLRDMQKMTVLHP